MYAVNWREGSFDETTDVSPFINFDLGETKREQGKEVREQEDVRHTDDNSKHFWRKSFMNEEVPRMKTRITASSTHRRRNIMREEFLAPTGIFQLSNSKTTSGHEGL